MLLIKVKFESFKNLETKLKIVFSTKEEINPIMLAQLSKTEGYLAFNADQFKKEVEDAMKDTSIGITESGKSQSKLFRGLLFQIALKNNFDPDDYYNQEMERIRNHYKLKYL